MADKKVHLVCNAHLDPVWLWQRTEGIAAAISTFRVAADFCERYDNFVFNHNEAVLYEWVKENEPELFERIQKLVKLGKWRIMSGWYLQPDVIMPCGESIIRQIRTGNEFFKKYFGDIPKTSINFDSFGHSRGLVRILKKCGYENYAYVRPRETECGPFVWKGFDGSCINTLKLYEWYNTPMGKALERIENYLKDFPDRELSCLTWGVGNHGGGPSEKDLNDINRFAEELEGVELIHSDFDTYFSELDKSQLRVVNESLMHCMIGCYTSMVRVKQGHRNLENRLNLCEKMLCQSGVEYDADELKEAERALLFTEFHDVLPGSAVRKTEEDSVRLIGYGDEIADRLIARSFFKLCSGQPKAKEGEIPVLIYNPHPYPVEADFEVEFQLAEQNYNDNEITVGKMRDENGVIVPCQNEKEDCTMNWDWRKKIVFHAVAKPMDITRFDCELYPTCPYEKVKPCTENDTHIILKNANTEVLINKSTGLVDKYCVGGKDMLNKGGIKIKAYRDSEDPWGMTIDGFEEYIGEFKLISDEAANAFRGYSDEKFPNVMVIENGELRTKIQAIFEYSSSYAVVTYTMSKQNDFLDIDVKMLTNDANTMFKLSFDTTLDENSAAMTQAMFGTEPVRKGEKEIAFQKWCGLEDDTNRLYVINAGSYGGSFDRNIINISLLRTAVNAAHPNELGRPIAPHDRVLDHIDMGERDFRFRLCANPEYIDYEAEIFNQKPFVLSFFPSGMGEKPKQGAVIDNKNILLSAFRKENNGILIRFYNSSNEAQTCDFSLGDFKSSISFEPFEVKTFIKNDSAMIETNMLGEWSKARRIRVGLLN